jgi:hypothetical protein
MSGDHHMNQKPVAWQGVHDHTDLYYRKPPQADVRPLYTTPPAAPVQEPVAWTSLTEIDWARREPGRAGSFWAIPNDPTKEIALYAAPRQWVELTEEEVNDCIKLPNRNLFARDGTTSQRIARAIEAKLKEKNAA